MGIWGFYLFSELFSCITEVLLALDTKYKWNKEQSEVHFFWSTWFPNGPNVGRIIKVQTLRSPLKDPVRFEDPPGTFSF